MDLDKFRLAPHAFLPDTFVVAIGMVVVNHAFLDRALMDVISFWSGEEPTPSTPHGQLVQKFRGLVRDIELEPRKQEKLLILADVIAELSKERNLFVHNLPYVINAPANEVSYLDARNQRMSRQPLEGVQALAGKTAQAASCLRSLLPGFVPDGAVMNGMTFDEVCAYTRSHAGLSPSWNDDSLFPWSDRLSPVVP